MTGYDILLTGSINWHVLPKKPSATRKKEIHQKPDNTMYSHKKT